MNRKPYEYLIVGAGLYGGIFAHEMTKRGKRCVIVEKRSHIGGNIYTEEIEGIQVHRYGAHIFHTNSLETWNYVNQFATFNQYMNSPVAMYQDRLYNLPFNMNTFHQLWGVTTPAQAQAKIEDQRRQYQIEEPSNLEEQALSLVGPDIYHTLIKGYTEKQWGRPATELPSFIIKRLPLRFTFDNNYFNDRYQGIPIGGYTKMVEKLLENVEVRLNSDFFEQREYYEGIAQTIVYTGMIDEYYNYCYGPLEYRSLRFETEILPIENYQGNAVMNYTEYQIPYTRIIEHKHFEFGTQASTVITKEYPQNWSRGEEPYYPINNKKNNEKYEKYHKLAQKEKYVIFGGRLGTYEYYDMNQVVEEALQDVEKEEKKVM